MGRNHRRHSYFFRTDIQTLWFIEKLREVTFPKMYGGNAYDFLYFLSTIRFILKALREHLKKKTCILSVRFFLTDTLAKISQNFLLTLLFLNPPKRTRPLRMQVLFNVLPYLHVCNIRLVCMNIFKELRAIYCNKWFLQ